MLLLGRHAFFRVVVARWIDEAVSLPEIDPRFQAGSLVAYQLCGLTFLSRVLHADFGDAGGVRPGPRRTRQGLRDLGVVRLGLDEVHRAAHTE